MYKLWKRPKTVNLFSSSLLINTTAQKLKGNILCALCRWIIPLPHFLTGGYGGWFRFRGNTHKQYYPVINSLKTLYLLFIIYDNKVISPILGPRQLIMAK